ncbi:aryl-sulfate sulfotransferase [Thermodesulfobacteriota bacterium]
MTKRLVLWTGILALAVFLAHVEVSVFAADDGASAPRMDVIDYSVLDNPNNAISAIFQVQGTGISSASVEYTCTDCGPEGSPDDWLSTPSFSVASDRFVLPVLGLEPNSSYLMKAVLVGPGGGREETAPLPFQSGAIPAELDLSFTAWGENASPGFVFVSQNFYMSRAAGFIIALDTDGDIAWYTHVPKTTTQSLVRISVFGTLLLYTTGADRPRQYLEIDLFGNVTSVHELPLLPGEEEGDVLLDNHEIILIPNGDKVFLTSMNYTMDLTEYSGLPDATLLSHGIRRVASGGTITFDWDYLDAFPLTDTTEDLGASLVDWTHANSIDIDEDGHYVLSSRNFCEVTKINSVDGSVIWRLGGKHSDFTFVNDDLDGFSHQHSAIMLDGNRLLMFDNGNFHDPQESRAVEYELDYEAMTATVVWEYRHDPIRFSRALCNAQRLPGGNTLVNYGILQTGPTRIVEATPMGWPVWEAIVPYDFANSGAYRAFKIEDLYFGAHRVGAYLDQDGDEWFGYFDCDDQAPGSYPGAEDSCDGIDQNCDGIDGIPEIPDNGLDDDCDGLVDETDACFIGAGLDS